MGISGRPLASRSTSSQRLAHSKYQTGKIYKHYRQEVWMLASVKKG